MSEGTVTARPGKVMCQIIGADNKPLQSKSAPDFFIKDQPSGAKAGFGPVFSPSEPGNNVQFFTTGKEYFKAVAAAIEEAKESVFIAGWQVNFDVVLDEKKRLIDCLKKAMNNGSSVYVMPWLSPKVGVNTHDFETMLAVFQLNAGRAGPPKAWAMPAIQQSDMGNLGLMFSHHQKLVVIDNQYAFVGGLDLAYGRRDDAHFSVIANSDGRTGNEMYNPCVPSLRSLELEEGWKYLSLWELLFATLDSGMTSAVRTAANAAGTVLDTKAVKSAREWLRGPSLVESATARAAELEEHLCKSWLSAVCGEESKKRVAAARDKVIETVGDAATEATISMAQKGFELLPPDVRFHIEQFRDMDSAMVREDFGILMAWLNNASLDSLSFDMRNKIYAVIHSIVAEGYRILSSEESWTQNAYPEALKRNMMPLNGKELDPSAQPRMPWQDVQARIEGPAVYHLARNFVQRWNSLQHAMLKASRNNEEFFASFKSPGIKEIISRLRKGKPFRPHYIAADHLPKKSTERKGECTVQVLRSASANLVRQENAASKMGLDTKLPQEAKQDNVLNATLQIIKGSQNFIYIEGQFFQSEFGEQVVYRKDVKSGPMAHQILFRSLPGYQEYENVFNLKAAEKADDPAALINWAKFYELKKAALEKDGKHKAIRKDFTDGLKRVLENKAQIVGFKKLSDPQKKLSNSVGKELAERIERAISDGQPFHVYIVLPVHPEGKLDAITIMTQIHLTMQSLVHGENSLVNRIKEAIATSEVTKKESICWSEAQAIVRKNNLAEMVKDAAWQEYLTLLNLRNWATVGDCTFTEQVYVHSKLLIADDRVAILGSANINDRSMLGDRDSELAVIIHDNQQERIPLTGGAESAVSKVVHNLRVDLWKKHFGLTAGGAKAATELADCLKKPGAPATWKKIQKRAQENQAAYEKVFRHIPRSESATNSQLEQGRLFAASIWPTWKYIEPKDHTQGGGLTSPMPFNEAFWTKSNAPKLNTAPLASIKGFITALPTRWTEGENNDSNFNLAVLAHNNYEDIPATQIAHADNLDTVDTPT